MMIHTFHWHFHAVNLDWEANVDHFVVHASVEGVLCVFVLVPHYNMRTACFTAIRWFCTIIVIGMRAARWCIIAFSAEIVYTIEEILVKFHFSSHLMAAVLWHLLWYVYWIAIAADTDILVGNIIGHVIPLSMIGFIAWWYNDILCVSIMVNTNTLAT